MTFEVKESEAEKFMHLIGLGNDVINYYRDEKDQKTAYAELAHDLMKQYLQYNKTFEKEKRETNSEYVRGYRVLEENIESVEDGVRSDCYDYVKAYEKCVLPYAAAQLFADRVCPAKAENVEEWENNDLAYEVLLDKIVEFGTSVLHIAYPDFKTEMERRYKEGAGSEEETERMIDTILLE